MTSINDLGDVHEDIPREAMASFGIEALDCCACLFALVQS
jgi:hypothetical protein